MYPYLGDVISRDELTELVERSYAGFAHPEITPLVHAGDLRILELFHGPTAAFKDVALQFLGNVFEFLYTDNNSGVSGPVTVQLTPPPDLTVTNINAPTEAVQEGTRIDVEWTVSNIGTGAAEGYWYDRVYLQKSRRTRRLRGPGRHLPL